MLVGIKYCGGCRASFDRKAEAENTVKEMMNTGMTAKDVSFVNVADSGRCDVLLAVCGCGSLCTDVSPFETGKIIYLNESGGAVKAARELVSVLNQYRVEEGDN